MLLYKNGKVFGTQKALHMRGPQGWVRNPSPSFYIFKIHLVCPQIKNLPNSLRISGGYSNALTYSGQFLTTIQE